jgi:hypothetical protein
MSNTTRSIGDALSMRVVSVRNTVDNRVADG